MLFQIAHGPDPSHRVALAAAAGGPVRTLGEGYAEAASIDTCDTPARGRAIDTVGQRWVAPNIVINFYQLLEGGRPGYEIEVRQLW